MGYENVIVLKTFCFIEFLKRNIAIIQIKLYV